MKEPQKKRSPLLQRQSFRNYRKSVNYFIFLRISSILFIIIEDPLCELYCITPFESNVYSTPFMYVQPVSISPSKRGSW